MPLMIHTYRLLRIESGKQPLSTYVPTHALRISGLINGQYQIIQMIQSIVTQLKNLC